MTPYQQAQQMLLEVFGLVKPVKRVRLEPAPNPAKVLNELQQQVNPTDVTEVIGTTADASSEIKDITTSPTPTDATEVSGGLAQNPPDILEQLLKASREVV